MKQYRLPDPPENMVLNTDLKAVERIYQSLATKTNGMCPCVPSYLHTNEDYRCPCKEARETNVCRCKLFVALNPNMGVN